MKKKCTKCGKIKSLLKFYKRTDGHGDGYASECVVCFKKRMGSRHQEHKDMLIAELGGECMKCGYDRSARVLTFHHIDPKRKDFGIAKKLSSHIDTLRKECKKCIILCPNCHAELHLGLWKIKNGTP